MKETSKAATRANIHAKISRRTTSGWLAKPICTDRCHFVRHCRCTHRWDPHANERTNTRSNYQRSNCICIGDPMLSDSSSPFAGRRTFDIAMKTITRASLRYLLVFRGGGGGNVSSVYVYDLCWTCTNAFARGDHLIFLRAITAVEADSAQGDIRTAQHRRTTTAPQWSQHECRTWICGWNILQHHCNADLGYNNHADFCSRCGEEGNVQYVN